MNNYGELSIKWNYAMKLNEEVLKTINTSKHRLVIAMAMGCTEWAIMKYINRNDVKLTQYSPLMVIKGIMKAERLEDLLEPEAETIK